MGGLNGKKIKRLKFLRPKTWQILLILIPLFYLDATLLRCDHLKMIELRDAVMAADASGNETEIAERLTELKDFTFSHIIINVEESNGEQAIFFGTAPFYLEQQYRRAAEAAIFETELQITNNDQNPNGNIFAMASDTCRPIAAQNGWAWYSDGYVKCMTDEIAKHPTTDFIIDTIYADIPSTELYRREYSSPIWTPCGSGIAILFTIIFLIILFIRFLIWLFIKIAVLFI